MILSTLKRISRWTWYRYRLVIIVTRRVERIGRIIWLGYCAVLNERFMRTTIFYEASGIMKQKLQPDLPDTWKKPFLFWWFLLRLSKTDLQTSTCGCRCVLGMWCDANVGRRGPYICASPDGPYTSQYPYPTAVGARALPVVLLAVGPKGQDPDRAEERQKWWPWITVVGGHARKCDNNNTADETVEKRYIYIYRYSYLVWYCIIRYNIILYKVISRI